MNDRRRGPTGARRCAVAALALGAACTPRADAAPAVPADFTVRGRLAGPRTLTWRIDAERAPIAADAFARAVARAAAVWTATGVVDLRAASGGEPANVTLSFRRGHHGACEPFGPMADVAHTGPLGSDTFVHFDAGRQWSEHGGGGLSVFHTALHELGHVLGLGHAEAEAAVMSNAVARPSALSAHDLAGLHSLYGGGVDAPSDLRIVAGDGSELAVLRAVAPASCCEHAVFDADGDGAAEVLVWRTDTNGHGVLRTFGFVSGARLARTGGPFSGAVAAGAAVGFTVGADGRRLMVSTFADGARQARQFDRHGVPGDPTAVIPADVLARAARPTAGDLDGDGRPERVVRRGP